MNNSSSAAFTDTKPHYKILDGLRGVAALIVIWYHIYECFPPELHIFGHGYLAVDFFFMLSGFVIGYAYDNRLQTGKLTLKGFFKRRIIRLHPMVILGIVIGAVAFLIQGGVQWDGTKVTTSALMIGMIIAMFMVPAVPGTYPEVRGNGEMFPLNGPTWSLFFEYLANIFYAIFLRRLSTKSLAFFTVASAIGLATFAVINPTGYGTLGVGWTIADYNFLGGILRVTFPFCAGLLLSRVFKPVKIKGAFWVCSVLLAAILYIPFIGEYENPIYNCIWEVCCIALIFPLIVYLGASGNTTDKFSSGICKFLGDISYPLYIVHYPSMYLFYAYIGFPNTFRTPSETWIWQIVLFAGNIILAYAALKLYDEPVRKWLSKK